MPAIETLLSQAHTEVDKVASEVDSAIVQAYHDAVTQAEVLLGQIQSAIPAPKPAEPAKPKAAAAEAKS
jgi:hypothetical protein